MNYEKLKKELLWQHYANSTETDILIVIHNHHEMSKNCIKSIEENTKNFNIFIWDNDSDPPFITKYHTIRSKSNLGFIIPNNELFKTSKSEYVVLLNNDTEVKEGWLDSIRGCLQNGYDIVGYQGCVLDENFIGYPDSRKFDYLSGWCLGFKRNIVTEELFDSNLEFAYGEDSDFCLRMKERGYYLYCLSLQYVNHFGSKTISTLKDSNIKSFERNHQYLRKKWQEKRKRLNVDFVEDHNHK